MSDVVDPFQKSRQESGVLRCPFQGENLPMILRHADVRAAAKDWKTYSSDAPYRVPIPSEEDARSMRQLPIETDPPVHGAYREIVEPFFQRAKLPDVVAKMETLIGGMIDGVLASENTEIVRDFSLPIQCKALTYLLDVPESEADIWIDWGVHVFKDSSAGGSAEKKGAVLERYLENRFNQSQAEPGPDFFTALNQASFDGRPLSREEAMGFANLTFAGGRDTIINSISNVLAYLAKKPEALEFLREDPSRITLASEEFFRVYMPLTHIGRVCPVATDVHGVAVPPQGRVSMGWAAANMDETVFPDPTTVKLDRKPNPHLSFGFGTHLCLGAPHARLVVRTLLKLLCEKVSRIEVLDSVAHTEREAEYSRDNGYVTLNVRMSARFRV
jgi:cytochrome P450